MALGFGSEVEEDTVEALAHKAVVAVVVGVLAAEHIVNKAICTNWRRLYLRRVRVLAVRLVVMLAGMLLASIHLLPRTVGSGRLTIAWCRLRGRT